MLLQRKANADAAVASDGQLTVALDTQLNDALIAEGYARECVSVLQNARRTLA